MSAEAATYSPQSPSLNVSKWRNLPMILVVGGMLLAVLGSLGGDWKYFGYSYLLAYVFFLSICLGSLFLVLIHHLFDAGWSVPIRRFCEHLSTILFPWMALLFLPIALLAKKIYPWMSEPNPKLDHALQANQPLSSIPGF